MKHPVPFLSLRLPAAFFLAAAALSPASPSTEVSTYVGANTTVDYQKSPTGAPLTSTRSRPGSSITATATPGSLSIVAAAAGVSNYGIAQGYAYAQDTYTITGGTGTGTATFTFYLSGRLAASRTSGSLATYDVGFDYNGFLSGRSDQNADSGTHPPQTIVFTRPFTYGVPFDLLASLSANLSMPDGSTGSADLTLRCAGYSVNGAAGYTGSSSAGTTRGSLLAQGAQYDGFTVANAVNHQSILTLRDGDAGAPRDLAVNFMPPVSGLPVASDIVDVKGTGTDLVVIQLSYDGILAAALYGWENVMLGWRNPATDQWINAVTGNSGGGSLFKEGPYDPARDYILGNRGIDRNGRVVWAVLDHNSQFAAIQGDQPAPPTSFEAWKIQTFTEAERTDNSISGPEADGDGDGLNNRQEYAFFTDARAFSSPPVTASFTGSGASAHLTASYRRRKGDAALVLEPQFSSNLSDWTPGVQVSTTDNFDGSETVVARDNIPAPGRRFLRISINP